MPRFAANLSTLYAHLPLTEACAEVGALGFVAAECLWPYAVPAASFRAALDGAALVPVLMNTPPGDREAGELGRAALPGREALFESDFSRALDYACALGCAQLHVMAGRVPAGVPRERCVDTFVANLRAVAPRARARGVRLLLEPLNRHDVPGYLHATVAETRAIIERVGEAGVLLQFDCYHLQITQGDLAGALRENLDLIGHVQFSSVPGRHEPQYGEVDMQALFELLDTLGYAGWVGCEYTPNSTLADGLGWGRRYGLGVGAGARDL
ncbi:MAG: TIM barrel protein [Gammaproteobacteria bacterium]